jgi:Dolichyl-phosphate-mannose-protein mannosyltransferase
MVIPRALPDRLSDILFKLVLMALAFAAASLLLRDAFAIGTHVPLDPNEGWNAYLAHAAVTGTPLYPQGLMINNYPPLSFYIVGAFGTITGDPIIAGRLVSLISFFALAGGLIVILRELGANVLSALFASLFFAVALLAASDYVAMDDPQLLGHALQLTGLSLLLQPRREVLAAALLMAAGLFVKHNLLALPLAAWLWLLWRDRSEAVRFAVAGLGFCLAGLAVTRLFLGINLIAALASPRHWAAGNFYDGAKQFLTWAGTALIIAGGLAWRRLRDGHLATLYAGIALVLGGIFAFGDGVDANVFFDAAIALALCTGLALVHLPKRWVGLTAFFVSAPLALYLARYHAEMDFTHTEAFAREAPFDIGFLRVHSGPALCQDLTLCYWAGKDEPVDVFNLSEAFVTGARSDKDLAHLLQSQYFASIALSSLTPFMLGPDLKTVLLAHYRVTHEDDNGVFLERRVP